MQKKTRGTNMSDYPPTGRFGGDMDRNEVEIDLNKFMALLQEKSELKDRIRELEDEKNDNPYQKLIFIAQAVDSWRIIPRAFLAVYMYLLYFTTFWFMDLANPTFEQFRKRDFMITKQYSFVIDSFMRSEFLYKPNITINVGRHGQ